MVVRIVEISGTWGYALASSLHSPTARAGSPTKAQPGNHLLNPSVLDFCFHCDQ